MVIRGALIAIVVLFGIGILAAGAFAAGFAARTLLRDGRTLLDWWRSRNWPTTPGTITHATLTEGRWRRGKLHGARIACKYHAAGGRWSSRRYRFDSVLRSVAQDEATADVTRFARGSAVSVFFDPRDPASAVLDRRRPDVVFPMAVVALLTLIGIGAVGAGVAVIRGPFADPPPLHDEELPPLSAQIGGLLGLTGLIGLWLARRDARRSQPHCDLLERLASVHEVRIAELQRGQDVALFGKVETGEEARPSPGTGEPAVYYRARALVDGETRLEDVHEGRFYLHDGSGRILISTGGCTDLLPVTRPPADAGWFDWLDSAWHHGSAAPLEFAVEVARILPGSSILVVGRVRPAADGNGFAIAATSKAPHPLVLAAEPLTDVVRHLSRPARRAKTLGRLAIATLLVAAALLLGVTG